MTLTQTAFLKLTLAEMLLDVARDSEVNDEVTYLEYRAFCYYLCFEYELSIAAADFFDKEHRTFEIDLISAWFELRRELITGPSRD